MMRFAALSLLVLALGTTADGFGQTGDSATPATRIYSCKDASGRVITSDRPIQECSDRTMEERSKGGILLREIAPPLTPAQQRQAEADEKKRRQAAEDEREQQRRDRALLTSYSSEKDIEGARSRALGDFNDAVASSNDRLALLYQERTANQHEAAAYKGQEVPYILQRKIDLNDAAISSEIQGLSERKADIDRINQRFDAELQRFRYLMSRMPKDQ